MRKFRHLSSWLIACAAATVLIGCDGSGTNAAADPSSLPYALFRGKVIAAELTGYNHTDKTIAAFYVNGQWGGNITPGSGGGSFVCCVELPRQWSEGLTVRVGWEDHEGKRHEQEVTVPRYEATKASDFNVHFLRSGAIKVFVTNMGLGHRDYPLSGSESELKPGVPIKIVE